MWQKMNIHTEEGFKSFMEELLETNATLGFYCDFEKIKRNVRGVEISLNTLNYLIGKQDLVKAIKELWEWDKSVFEVLPILIAVRKRDNKKVLGLDGKIACVNDYCRSLSSVIEFVENTGLAQVLKNKDIKNLVDYVFGVEAGLDTHARKNRSGDVMEDIVESIFKDNCVSYKKEVYSTDYPEVHQVLDGDSKRFDFVVENQNCTFLIEVNFYSDGGLKPNETARAYTELAPKIDSVKGFEFVWITDGQGWQKAKSMIKAAYMNIPNMYNLSNIHDFIRKVKCEE